MGTSTDPLACSLEDRGKPTFTFGGFVAALAGNAKRLPALLGAFAPPGRLDPAFREKIMVAISRMNRCRHCTAIHTAWAKLAGLSDLELAAIDGLDLEGLDRGEWLALQYARCLVAGGEVAELEQELRLHFSVAELERVAAVARAIDFANLSGNTWDALAGRLEGHPAPGSSLVDELAVVAALAPLGGPFLALSTAVRALRGQPTFRP